LLSAPQNTALSLGDLTASEWEQLSEEVTAGNNQRGAVEVQSAKGERIDHESSFLNILDLNGWNLSKSLQYCERSLLKCALQYSQGNQSQTARLIGITPRSVYNKLHKHKLHH